MQSRHPLITYAYHFLSETIIIFIIAVPFFHHRFAGVPYWDYLAVIFGTTAVFSLITAFTERYIWYWLMLPVLFVVFSLLDFPTLFVVLFSILFIWRYMAIRKEEGVNRENRYLVITIVLTVLVSFIVNDTRILLFPFVQFTFLTLGYIASHFAVMEERDRKQFDLKTPLLFGGIFGGAALLLYLLFDGVRYFVIGFWNFFRMTIDASINFIANNILSFWDVEKRTWADLPEQDVEYHGDGYWNELQEFSATNALAPFLVIGIILVLATVVAAIIYFLWKRTPKVPKQQVEDSEGITYYDLDEKSGKGNSFSEGGLKRYFTGRLHPVRKMVLQFERRAAKNNKARKPFETIEEWLKRLGMQGDLDVYQRVRYGDSEVSAEERKVLKEQLQRMEEGLEG